MFYTYSQNNSGGTFDINDLLSYFVIIEADSEREANEKAENIGIYFNGCSLGLDCSCCGDRWYYPDKYEKPTIYGDDVSTGVYNNHRSLYQYSSPIAYIHYKNGLVQPVHCQVEAQ
jgi:hypothetical protein